MREEFRFSEEVLKHFSFLTEQFGFVVVKKEPTLVRFESKDIFLNVYHGRRSFELQVEIGERTTKDLEYGFTLGEIISVSDPRAGAAYRAPQVTDPTILGKHLAGISELVKKHAILALVGDKAFFKRASDLQANISEEYLTSLELNRVRAEADIAWREKDYSRIISILEPVLSHLTPSERMKLEFARRKVQE